MSWRHPIGILGLLGLLALLALPGVVLADDAELSPSAAVQCLDEGGPGNKLVYPEDLLLRKDGGSVAVEMRFDAPDVAPAVQVLNKGGTADGLIDAVTAHVRHFRVPCMDPGGPPVVLRRTYVFQPNDGRKVVSTTLQDADDARRAALFGCMHDANGSKRPDYPIEARRQDAQGNVFVSLRFTAPDRPPEVQVLAAPPSRDLKNAVTDFVQGLRLPCLTGPPVTETVLYQFMLDGGSRTLLKDMSLLQLLRFAKESPKDVYFDLGTMDCPFDLRMEYFRPYRPNRLLEVTRSVPARLPLMDWLTQITLNLPNEQNIAVLGQEITLHVPCGKIDL